MLDDTNEIDTVFIIGDGKEMDILKDMADPRINTKFLGILSRADLNKIYEKSHIFILPSKTPSKTFPKSLVCLKASLSFVFLPASNASNDFVSLNLFNN